MKDIFEFWEKESPVVIAYFAVFFNSVFNQEITIAVLGVLILFCFLSIVSKLNKIIEKENHQ